MTTSRIFYYDVLNVVSSVSVIALHCNSYVHHFDTADEWWWLHVLIEVAFYNAVPIFFMLSGATLLDYHTRYGTLEFYRRRIRKAFVPYAAFTCVIYVGLMFLSSHPENYTVESIVHGVLSGEIPFADYWFFRPLFLMYLFMPFLSVMVSNLTNRQVLGLIVLLVGLQGIALPLLKQVDVTWYLPIGGYVTYLLLGYYLSRTSWEKNDRVLFAIVFLGILLMTLRYIGIYMSDCNHPVLFNYLSAYGFVASSAIFLTVKRLCNKGGGERENYTLPFQKEFWCLSHTAFHHMLLLVLRHTRRQSLVFSFVPRSLPYVCCRCLAPSTV